MTFLVLIYINHSGFLEHNLIILTTVEPTDLTLKKIWYILP